MLSPIQNAEMFLVNTLFDLYLLILMIRLILCWARADYFNPITRFIIVCTQPIIAPLRRLLPTYAKIEFSTLFLIILLNTLKFFLVGLIAIGIPKNSLGLLLLASVDAFKLLLNTFFYAIFLQAIISWIQPGFSPIAVLLTQLTAPIMRPIQRVMPTFGGFDLSPIPALILLQLLIILVANPLMNLGTIITFS